MSFRLIAPAALLLLGACDTVYPASESIDPGFGEAAKYSMAIQVIDPDPVYTAEGAQPGDNGEKASGAAKRHRTGQVKQVEAQATGSSGAGGSGSGSGPR